MNVQILKRNSIKFPSKLNIVEYSLKNDSNPKINTKKAFKKKNDTKKNNNIYKKPEYNIQKKTNESRNSLKYTKSIDSNILKNEKNKVTNNKKNNNSSTPDIRTDKNEETVSTVPFTKENIENRKSLSCEKRKINKDMIFVKKKIQGNLKNSFILYKSEEKENSRNNSCFSKGYSNTITNNANFVKERFNTNNSVDFGGNNYYNNNNINCIKKNFLNDFQNDDNLNNLNNNSVLITNNNINLITNNNYINNCISRNDLNEMKRNAETMMTRTNNSVRLRKNRKIMNNYFYSDLNGVNNNASPNIRNLKNYNGSQSIRYRNMINYIDNLKNFNSDNVINNNNNLIHNNDIAYNDNDHYNTMEEKNIIINNQNINRNNMNNIPKIKNEYNINAKSNYDSKLNNDLLKDFNFEDLYLILKKFEIIKNNIILLGNLKNHSNKNLLENINMCRIFIYDLYKFYLNSSFEGCPQNLFKDKTAEIYLHFYSVILIISLGLTHVIAYKLKFLSDFRNKILLLINKLQKGFLFFCDAIFENFLDKGINNMWINEIMKELNNEKIPYGIDHILFIKKIGIEGYKIFNEIIKNIYNNNISNNKINEQELFLYRHFQNKSMNYLAQINIYNLEEIFDDKIFKIKNFKTNFANISLNKKDNKTTDKVKPLLIQDEKLINSQNLKSKKRAEITSLLFHKENIHNINNINNNINNIITSSKFDLIKNYTNKNKTTNKPQYQNKPKNNNKNQNQSKINFKNLIKTLKVKEPYLDFPPSKPYTLVLDLDETLISFQFISQEKGLGEMHLRPGLESFLEIIKEYYEIIIFTSGTREYADMVLDVIEHKKQKKLFDGRLYREHTVCIGNKYIKDLSKIGRDLSKTLIVDNLPHSFKFQHENGILISSFYGDDNGEDKALFELQKILIKIYEENNDVRKSIIKFKEEIIRKVSCLDLNQYKQIYSEVKSNNAYNDIFYDTVY